MAAIDNRGRSGNRRITGGRTASHPGGAVGMDTGAIRSEGTYVAAEVHDLPSMDWGRIRKVIESVLTVRLPRPGEPTVA